MHWLQHMTTLMQAKKSTLLCIFALGLSVSTSFAQEVVRVSQTAWNGLTTAERDAIQKKFVVSLHEEGAFGMIIDAQGVNESTSGTSGGAALGGAVANAAYIDTAIRGGNYSAKTQLAAGILGAILGSTLDSPGTAKYHFRYAVKLANGNIQYFDEIKSDAFRHPAGVCVAVPVIALIDQRLCGQTPASLRATFLPPPSSEAPVALSVQPVELGKASGGASDIAPPAIGSVNCKMGTLAPVKTSAEKCKAIAGRVIDD